MTHYEPQYCFFKDEIRNEALYHGMMTLIYACSGMITTNSGLWLMLNFLQNMSSMTMNTRRITGSFLSRVVNNAHYDFSKEYHEHSVRLPFEDTTIPVPARYNQCLKDRYGDYLVIRKGAHLPEFTFDVSMPERIHKDSCKRMPGWPLHALQKLIEPGIAIRSFPYDSFEHPDNYTSTLRERLELLKEKRRQDRCICLRIS